MEGYVAPTTQQEAALFISQQRLRQLGFKHAYDSFLRDLGQLVQAKKQSRVLIIHEEGQSSPWAKNFNSSLAEDLKKMGLNVSENPIKNWAVLENEETWDSAVFVGANTLANTSRTMPEKITSVKCSKNLNADISYLDSLIMILNAVYDNNLDLQKEANEIRNTFQNFHLHAHMKPWIQGLSEEEAGLYLSFINNWKETPEKLLLDCDNLCRQSRGHQLSGMRSTFFEPPSLEDNRVDSAKLKLLDNIPPPIKYFADRSHNNGISVIEAIENQLSQNSLCALTQQTILAGNGGVGKTQASFYYAKKHREQYPGCARYIKSDDPSTLNNSLHELAIALEDIYEGKNPSLTKKDSDIVFSLKHTLERLPKSIILFDNVENSTLLDLYLPLFKKHHIIVTSRYSNWPGYLIVSLGTLKPEEAVSFIKNIFKKQFDRDNETEDAIKELAKELGYLPLALSQAVHTMKKNTSIKDYLAEYRESQYEKKLLLDEESLPKDESSRVVFKTWSLIRKRLEQDHTETLRLLNILAYLDPDQIIFKDNLLKLFEMRRDLRTSIDVMIDYSLVDSLDEKEACDSMRVHRLLQEAIRLNQLFSTTDLEKTKFLENALDLVSSEFPYDLKDLDSIPISELLLPHALSVLHHLYNLSIKMNNIDKKRILFTEADQENIKTLLRKSDELLEKILHYYNYWKQGFGALSLANDFVISRRTVFGDESAEYAESLARLGEIEYYYAKYDLATQHLELCMKIYEKIGMESLTLDQKIKTFDAYAQLGDVDYKKGLYNSALTRYQTVIENFEDETLSSKIIELKAKTTHQMGNVCFKIAEHEKSDVEKIKKYSAAKEYYETSYQSWTTHYTPAVAQKHPQVARTTRTLGDTLLMLGIYKNNKPEIEKAYELINQSLLVQESRHGPDHPDVIKTRYSLAETTYELGKADEHKALMEKIRATPLPYENNTPNPSLISCITRIGAMYYRHGEHELGKEKLTQARDYFKLKFKENHPEIIYCDDLLKKYFPKNAHQENKLKF